MYQDHESGGDHAAPLNASWIWRVHFRFNAGFEKLRLRYSRVLDWVLGHAGFALGCFALFAAISACTIPYIGQDFFPQVDAGSFRLHVRTAPGTRIEQVEHIFTQIDATIREQIPASELGMVLDDIGIPNGSFNLAFGDGSLTDVQDGEILVQLNENHRPTETYRRNLRELLHQRFPDVVFYFQASDIVNQILNFGLPAPIDIQLSGRNFQANYALMQKIRRSIAAIPGATDVHINQIVYSPELHIDVDRARASTVGLTESSVANSMLYALAGSGTATPNYWLNPVNGVNYSVVVQTPQYQINSVDDVRNIPVTSGTTPSSSGAAPQQLSNVAQVVHTSSPAITNHYNVQPVYDVLRQRAGA